VTCSARTLWLPPQDDQKTMFRCFVLEKTRKLPATSKKTDSLPKAPKILDNPLIQSIMNSSILLPSSFTFINTSMNNTNDQVQKQSFLGSASSSLTRLGHQEDETGGDFHKQNSLLALQQSQDSFSLKDGVQPHGSSSPHRKKKRRTAPTFPEKVRDGISQPYLRLWRSHQLSAF
jgi:hypothetical protein